MNANQPTLQRSTFHKYIIYIENKEGATTEYFTHRPPPKHGEILHLHPYISKVNHTRFKVIHVHEYPAVELDERPKANYSVVEITIAHAPTYVD